MNKIHRVIWSAVRQTWVAASETSRSHGKSASTRKGVVGTIATALIATLPLHAHAAPPAPNALPTGGQVVAGQASIAQSGATMTVNQTSNRAILNWNTFNIGANAAVTFQQPSSNAVALNRVIGTDPSAIYGKLSANGQVFLINPNGVLFGQGARVDVGGLVASTLNISNADFLAGNNRFTRDGSTGSVVNQGELIGKYVALLAPEVRNAGVIAARQGTVALAAGEAVTLSLTGNNLIDVQVDKASINTLVENKQLVQADAGTVILSAQSANQLLGQVVNSGTVEANGIAADGGIIRLRASSTINNSGTLLADAAANGKGGTITAIADLTNPNSLTTVDGTLSAKGGSVSGDGGFIETSASHLKIADTATVNTTAANGKAGQWLLDPVDFTIAVSGGDISGTTLTTNLNNGNVTILSSQGAAGTNGDILVQDSIGIGLTNWTSANTLTLSAYRNVDMTNINANIVASGGAGNIVLRADNTGTGVGTVTWDSVNAPLRVVNGAGTISIYYNPTSYATPTDFGGATGLVSPGAGAVNTYMQLFINNASATAQSKTYDGTTTATLNTPFTLSATTAAGTPTGATLNAGTAAFADKNAGTGKTVTFSGYTASGTVAIGATGRSANYYLAAQPANKTANITPKALTESGLSAAASKVYDGTTAATVTGTAALLAAEAVGAGNSTDGRPYTGDTVSIVGTATGTYNSKDVSTASTVTFGGLSSSNSNYTITMQSPASATISKAQLSVQAYSGTITQGDPLPTMKQTLSGFVPGENASVVSGSDTSTTTATATSTAAAYKTVAQTGGYSSANYMFVRGADGKLIIAPSIAPSRVFTSVTEILNALKEGSVGANAGLGQRAYSALTNSKRDYTNGEANDRQNAAENGYTFNESRLAENRKAVAAQAVARVTSVCGKACSSTVGAREWADWFAGN